MNIKVILFILRFKHSLKYFPTAIIKTAPSAVMILQYIVPLNMCFKNKPASTKIICVSSWGRVRIEEWQQDHKQIKGFLFGISTYPSLIVLRESDKVQ